jgi:hypothetical protein
MKTVHDFLTDQGAYVHTHIDADFDDGDAENGPGSGGFDQYDLYEGDSHDIIVQHGLIVDLIPIDWDQVRFFETFSDGCGVMILLARA